MSQPDRGPSREAIRFAFERYGLYTSLRFDPPIPPPGVAEKLELVTCLISGPHPSGHGEAPVSGVARGSRFLAQQEALTEWVRLHTDWFDRERE